MGAARSAASNRRTSSDALIDKACVARLLWPVDIPQVDQDGFHHHLLQPVEVERAELSHSVTITSADAPAAAS